MAVSVSSPSALGLSSKHYAALLCASGVVLRWLAVPATVGDVDSVNHASALAGFDLLHQAPHFPGYPVYTAATWLFALFCSAESWALALPGIVLFGVAAVVFYRTLASCTSEAVALGALGLSALAPVAVVASAWPSSDGFGFSWLLLCAGLALHPARKAAFVAALCLGLGFGVRLSYAPALLALVVLLAVRRRDLTLIQLAFTVALGISIWMLPMALWVGPNALWTLAAGFSSGHFQQFGGSAFSDQETGSRIVKFVWSLWDAGLGAAYPLLIPGGLGRGEGRLLSYVTAAMLLLALAGLLRPRSAPHSNIANVACLVSAPYVLWLLLAQNPDKPRHLLPLLPVLGVLLATGLQRLRCGWQVQAVLFAAMAAVAMPRALIQGSNPVPAVAVANRLQEILHENRSKPLLVMAGPESRLLQYRFPSLRVLRPVDYEVALQEAARAYRFGVDVLMTSTITNMPATPVAEMLLDARFDASVRPQDTRIALYRFGDAGRATNGATVVRADLTDITRGFR